MKRLLKYLYDNPEVFVIAILVAVYAAIIYGIKYILTQGVVMNNIVEEIFKLIRDSAIGLSVTSITLFVLAMVIN